MPEFSLQKMVLGHNQFFGVDHLSSERGIQRAAYFSKPENIKEVVDFSVKCGARGMMLSTHERSTTILDLVREDQNLSDNLVLYPLLPYLQKYVVAANEKGMLNVVFDMIKGAGVSSTLGLISKGSQVLLKKKLIPMLSALMDIELKSFKGMNVGAIFLHDAFTDLGLALDAKEIFEFYIAETEKKFKAKGAFATKNLPALLEKFSKWNLGKPVVMTHFNKAGYHMNPSREECEAAAENNEVSIMAMGSLASGYLKPDEAYEYLGSIASIDSVVVGASSKKHIEDTFSNIENRVFSNR